MSIAVTRCLNSSGKYARTFTNCRLWRWRRPYSSKLDVPPHLERPPEPTRILDAQTTRKYRVKPYYITTPIFYPNAVPHIGHLYSLVVADIFARNARLTVPTRIRPVHFVTGTDEHGLKIQKAAQERKMEPQEFVDLLCHDFSALAKKAEISHTRFVRTSAEEHCYAVQTLWTNLVKSGHVYLGEHNGWYSVSDECFYTDTQIRTATDLKTGAEVKVSIETGNIVEWTKEENYKFALSKFKIPLLEHFRANPDAICPPNQLKDVMVVLESNDPKALPDLSISRPSWRLKWGIPVPGDSSQTIYVWLDALTSYLTGIGYPWLDAPDMTSHGWPADLQIIGKDILKFHAIYFPAFLMALDMPIPRGLLSHAHWTVRKAKISKSVGNVVDPVAVLNEHGVDSVRWYLARTGGYFKADVDWNDDQLLKSADELRSLLGNILLRLQSRKILEKILPAFRAIPLHRAILMSRGNAPVPLSEPGSEDYDDRLEDRRYTYEISNSAIKVNYAKEYTERLAHDNLDFSVSGPLPMRTSRVIWYSEVPKAKLDDEVPIVSPELRDALDMLRGKVSYHLQRFEVGDATQTIVDVLSLLNKEITRIKPWSDDTQPRDIVHLLTWGRETLRICGILLQPFIPNAAQALLDAMHTHPAVRTYAYARIGAGRVRSGPLERRILFPSKGARAWKEVEADHKFEENRRRKKQHEQVEKGRPLYKIRHRRILNPRQNNLYKRLFRPYGAPLAPNCISPLSWRKKSRPTLPKAKATEQPTKSTIHSAKHQKRQRRRERHMLKNERQRAREPF